MIRPHITGKRGIDAWMTTIIALVLIMIFALLAISFYASGGTSATQSLSAKVLSKINVGAIPIPQFRNLIPESAKTKSFEANILIWPRSNIYCEDENIILSAYGSKLPANVTWADMDCAWDLDTTKEANCTEKEIQAEQCDDRIIFNDCIKLRELAQLCKEDKIPNNDIDKTACQFNTNYLTTNWTGTTIKLTLKIARGETALGETRDATAAIPGVTPLCFCDDPTSNRHCLLGTKLTGKVITDESYTNFTLPAKEGPSMYNVNVIGVHIKVNADEFVKHLWAIGNKRRSNYASLYYEAFNVSSGEFMIEDSSLVDRINEDLQDCRNNGENLCDLSILWFTNIEAGSANLTIEDVNIPYNLTMF